MRQSEKIPMTSKSDLKAHSISVASRSYFRRISRVLIQKTIVWVVIPISVARSSTWLSSFPLKKFYHQDYRRPILVEILVDPYWFHQFQILKKPGTHWISANPHDLLKNPPRKTHAYQPIFSLAGEPHASLLPTQKMWRCLEGFKIPMVYHHLSISFLSKFSHLWVYIVSHICNVPSSCLTLCLRGKLHGSFARLKKIGDCGSFQVIFQ